MFIIKNLPLLLMFAALRCCVAREGVEELKSALFKAVLDNNTQEVKHIIEEANKKNLGKTIVEAENSDGKRPIHIATEGNNLELIKILRDQGRATIDAIYFCKTNETYYQLTPLQIAAKENFTDIANYIGEALALTKTSGLKTLRPITLEPKNSGPKTFVPDKESSAQYKFPLHYAVQNNNLELVRLLSRHEPDAKDSEGFTSLYYAIKNGNVEVIKALLSAGAERYITNGVGNYSPLHAVVIATQNIEPMVDVLNSKCSVFIPDGIYCNLRRKSLLGDTPLGLAIRLRNVEASKKFINEGALLDERFLVEAVNKGCPEIASLLVKADINVTFCLTEMGWTEWHLFIYTKQLNVLDAEIMDADTIDFKDKKGLTALHIAVKNDFFVGAKILLERGASVNSRDSRGASVNSRDSRGASPILNAVEEERFKMVNLLYSYGADINIQDDRGRSAAALAESLFNKSIPQIIEYELSNKH